MPAPVYVINLDRCPDRLQIISANLDRIGLPFARIGAIDGQTLGDDPACRRMSPGHVGCARSHYKAHSAFLDTDAAAALILDTDAAAALILEDDVEVAETVPRIVQFLDRWPEGHGLVKLDSTFRDYRRIWLGRTVGFTPDGRALRPILHSHLGAYGYMIDRKTARAVMEVAPDTPLPIDHMLFNLMNSAFARRVRPLQTMPAAVRHLPYDIVGSYTGSSRVDGKKRWKPGRLSRARYKAAWLWQRLAGKVRRLRVPFDGGN